jgi:magnesium chelatase family protein
VLRQPLELRRTTITRAAGSVTFPSACQLVAAMNPCPCGYYGSRARQCRCTPGQIQKYRARISGPLLDRIDLHVDVGTLTDQEMLDRPRGEASVEVRERVVRARDRQNARFAGTPTTCNAAMTPKQLQAHCELDKQCRNLMEMAINELQLSNRAFDRILRVSRTLADLEGHETLAPHHISEAIQFRSLDRRMW